MSDVLVVAGLGLLVAATWLHFGQDPGLYALGIACLLLAFALADGVSVRQLLAAGSRRARSKLHRAKRGQ